MTRVKAKGIPVLVCVPTMADEEFLGSEVTHDLEGFRRRADVIVANRWSDELSGVGEQVYTRVMFRRDWDSRRQGRRNHGDSHSLRSD